MTAHDNDDFRGSTPVMSSKDLLLELWHDMKIVRPIAEELKSADVLGRLTAIEVDHAVRDARGGAPGHLVSRVEALEDVNEAALAGRSERHRIAGMTHRTIAIVVLLSNFILGLIIMFVSLIKGITL